MLTSFSPSTFPTVYASFDPVLGTSLRKGQIYKVLVLCFGQTDTQKSSDITNDDLDAMENFKVSAVATALSGPPQALTIKLAVAADQVALEVSWSAPLDQGLGLLQPVNILNFSVQISQTANFSYRVP